VVSTQGRRDLGFGFGRHRRQRERKKKIGDGDGDGDGRDSRIETRSQLKDGMGKSLYYYCIVYVPRKSILVNS
jgi:hypothetical protein